MPFFALLRRVLGLWKVRRLPRVGGLPLSGTVLVLEKQKFALPSQIDEGQWLWLARQGWRKRISADRRSYRRMPRKAVLALLESASRAAAQREIVEDGMPDTVQVVTKVRAAQRFGERHFG